MENFTEMKDLPIKKKKKSNISQYQPKLTLLFDEKKIKIFIKNNSQHTQFNFYLQNKETIGNHFQSHGSLSKESRYPLLEEGNESSKGHVLSLQLEADSCRCIVETGSNASHGLVLRLKLLQGWESQL